MDQVRGMESTLISMRVGPEGSLKVHCFGCGPWVVVGSGYPGDHPHLAEAVKERANRYATRHFAFLLRSGKRTRKGRSETR